VLTGALYGFGFGVAWCGKDLSVHQEDRHPRDSNDAPTGNAGFGAEKSPDARTCSASPRSSIAARSVLWRARHERLCKPIDDVRHAITLA
jgi:hypothetical protein